MSQFKLFHVTCLFLPLCITAQSLEDAPLLFTGIDDSAQCTGCGIGYYVATGINIGENPSTVLNQGASNLTPLQISGTDGLSCQPCPAGTFSMDNSSNSCTDCPTGHSQSQAGRGYCEPCPSGTFTRDVKTKECIECSPGSFQNNTAQTICDLCDAGTYSAGYGSSNCTNCELGTYSLKGSKLCKACPAGSFGKLDSPGFCQACPYSSDGKLQSSDVVGAMDEFSANCQPMDTIFGNCSVRSETQCKDNEYLYTCGGTSSGYCKNCSDLCAPQMTSHKCIDRNPGCCKVPWGEPCHAPYRSRETGVFLQPLRDYTNAQFLVLHQTCEKGHYMSITNAIEFLQGELPNEVGVFDEDSNSQTNTSCLQCPIGIYNNNAGSDSIDDCLKCPAGTYGEQAILNAQNVQME